MKTSVHGQLIILGGLFANTSLAFQQQQTGCHSRKGDARPCSSYLSAAFANDNINAVDFEETASRDIGAMEEWATACGVQTADCFQLTVTSNEGEDAAAMDVGVMTTDDLPAASPVLFVPAGMVLSSVLAKEEFGASATEAEELFDKVYNPEDLPYFYLMVKLMAEYEKGDQSPWYAWLNSLPRRFSNGLSMTFFCYECLPPLVSQLAQEERTRFSSFFRALRYVYCLGEDMKSNENLAKWAFSVVFTRSFEVGPGDVRIVPMADMFNHASEVEVEISHDDEGNCHAYSTYDVPAGSPLQISYTGGDNTNPSNLFARYGFLDETSPATFCKIHIPRPSPELVNMGCDPSRMLFYKDSGSVSEEVWDVLLYRLLESNDPDIKEIQQGFYEAHMNGDHDTKQSYHEHYFAETSAALREHVDTFLEELDKLSNNAAGRGDLNRHPRLPLIQRHNEYVKKTFLDVRAQL